MTSLLRKTPLQSRHKEVIIQPVILSHFSASTHHLHYYLSFNKWSHFYLILFHSRTLYHHHRQPTLPTTNRN